MDQWKQSGDCCGRTSGITSLADVLPERCRCGLISLKRRNVGKDVITPPVPEKEWVGVLTHQLKEQALQRFLRGQVFMKACGTLLIDGDKTQHSMVFLDKYPGRQPREIAVRHHLCFLCSEHMEKSRVLQCLQAQGDSVSQGSSSAGSNSKKRVMSQNEILSQGEFHVSLRWEGIGQVAICLQKPSLTFNGERVRIFVGEYVGPEHYAIAALQASRKNPKMSAALRGLLGEHAQADAFEDHANNPMHGLTVPRLNGVLSIRGMQVSSDMIHVVNKWSESKSGCLALAAAPGAGKSVMSAAALVARMDRLEPNECIALLSMKRMMRDARLSEVRSFAFNPLHIVGLGRPLDRGAASGEEEEWDNQISQFLETRLGRMLYILRNLKKELEVVRKDLDLRTRDGVIWKQKTEHMHTLSVQFYAAKLATWEEITSNMKAVSMTVDGFLQSLSKDSALSRLMTGKNSPGPLSMRLTN